MRRASRLAGVGRDGWGFLPDVAAAMGLSAARARAQAPRGSRRRLRALGLAVLGALVISLVVSQAAQAYVYWAAGTYDSIARANLDGTFSGQSFQITRASSPVGVAVDAAHVYWARLPGRHRVDWLYSATGISMQGDGVGLDGRPYHIDNLGAGGWVTPRLRPTAPGVHGWHGGSPAWRSGGYWRNARHALTFPLEAGGWANGTGVSAVTPPAGITFAAGPSRPLRYYRTIPRAGGPTPGHLEHRSPSDP